MPTAMRRVEPLAECLARYLATAKRAAGDPSMTDGELAQLLGFERAQPISDMRRGKAMAPRRALVLGRFLHARGLVEHPFDVVLSVAIANQSLTAPEVAAAGRDFARRVKADRAQLRALTEPRAA